MSKELDLETRIRLTDNEIVLGAVKALLDIEGSTTSVAEVSVPSPVLTFAERQKRGEEEDWERGCL